MLENFFFILSLSGFNMIQIGRQFQFNDETVFISTASSVGTSMQIKIIVICIWSGSLLLYFGLVRVLGSLVLTRHRKG